MKIFEKVCTFSGAQALRYPLEDLFSVPLPHKMARSPLDQSTSQMKKALIYAQSFQAAFIAVLYYYFEFLKSPDQCLIKYIKF